MGLVLDDRCVLNQTEIVGCGWVRRRVDRFAGDFRCGELVLREGGELVGIHCDTRENKRPVLAKANLGCDYEVWPNPLGERVNSSKGAAMPSLGDLNSIAMSTCPKSFGWKMTEEKRQLLRNKHRKVL
eukprot:4533725-Prymnesium_polylepis.1